MGLFENAEKKRVERRIDVLQAKIVVTRLRRQEMAQAQILAKEEAALKLLELEQVLIKQINDINLLKNPKKKSLEELQKEKKELEDRLTQVRTKIHTKPETQSEP